MLLIASLILNWIEIELYVVLPLLQGSGWSVGRGQGETSGASAPPAMVQQGAERGAGWGPSLDPTALYPTGNRHTSRDLPINQHISPLVYLDQCVTCLFVPQGCESCNTVAGVIHSPQPPATDTWETWNPNSQWASPARNPPSPTMHLIRPVCWSDSPGLRFNMFCTAIRVLNAPCVRGGERRVFSPSRDNLTAFFWTIGYFACLFFCCFYCTPVGVHCI